MSVGSLRVGIAREVCRKLDVYRSIDRNRSDSEPAWDESVKRGGPGPDLALLFATLTKPNAEDLLTG